MKQFSLLGNKEFRNLITKEKNRGKKKWAFLLPDERQKMSLKGQEKLGVLRRIKKEKLFFGEEGPPLLGKEKTEELLKKLTGKK